MPAVRSWRVNFKRKGLRRTELPQARVASCVSRRPRTAFSSAITAAPASSAGASWAATP